MRQYVVVENTRMRLLLAGVEMREKPYAVWLNGHHTSPGAAVFEHQLQAIEACKKLGLNLEHLAFHPCPPDVGNFASVVALGLSGLSRLAFINENDWVVGEWPN